MPGYLLPNGSPMAIMKSPSLPRDMSKLATMSPDQQREIRGIENKGSAPLEELARKNGRTTAAYLGKALLKHGLSKSQQCDECDECDGTGLVVCKFCNGMGWTRRVSITRAPSSSAVSGKKACSQCVGPDGKCTGKKTCGDCKGSGKAL